MRNGRRQKQIAMYALDPAQVRLQQSLFKQRWQINREYLASLEVDNLLQNHRFEAGCWGPAAPLENGHQGWECPNSMVRGHFLGHWMSAVARVVQATDDQELAGKLHRTVRGLADLQTQNGGEWALSIPPRYFDRLARGLPTWAVQYVAEKTLTGLFESYRCTADTQALEVLTAAASWFHRWSGQFGDAEFADILDYETGAMMRLWADLWAVTADPKHEELMRRYERHRLFDRLLAGEDVLTNRHANTTLPEAQGMARAYEVTGESHFRDAVLAYWEQAVTNRGWFATGGQTCGEVWTAPQQLSARRGERNQEHCVAFNTMRLAETLLRWTGEVGYAEHYERILWNAILAQQHPVTGMVSYFLPLGGGGRKSWSTPTGSFWCCVGTLVEAHARHGTESWYETDGGLVLAQPTPTILDWQHAGAQVHLQLLDGPPGSRRAGRVDLAASDPAGPAREHEFHLTVESSPGVDFALQLRLPEWLSGDASVVVDGRPVDTGSGPSSWLTLDRHWRNSTVHVRLGRALRAVGLPDRSDLVAFADGPVVLAGLLDGEVELEPGPGDPQMLLEPAAEREWDRWTGRWTISGQPRSIRLIPLHEVTDEAYSVYFPIRTRRH